MTVLNVLVVAYATIAVVFILAGLLSLISGVRGHDAESQVLGAGMLLLALVWPVLLIVVGIFWTITGIIDRREARVLREKAPSLDTIED